MSKALDKGKAGEKLAAAYLERHGFKVLCMNFHSKNGEIDIIAKNKEYIIFVEVKTRKSASMIKPIEAVGRSKQLKIIKTSFYYMMKNFSDLQPRFDVIEVIMDDDCKDVIKINHIENAFSQEGDYALF